MAVSEKRKAYLKEYRKRQRQKLIDYFTVYRQKNHKRILEYAKKYKENNEEKIKQYHKKYKKRYVALNRNILRIKSNIYKKKRWKTDINYRLLEICRHRINKALKGYNKSKHTRELLGCSIEEFKTHIENIFLKGMSWNNYGYGKNKWHIDHIIPCDAFDLTNPAEQKECFCFTNLRPLWQTDNIKKSNKIIDF